MPLHCGSRSQRSAAPAHWAAPHQRRIHSLSPNRVCNLPCPQRRTLRQPSTLPRRRRPRGRPIRRLFTTNCELGRLRTPPRTLTRSTRQRGAAVTPTAPAAAGAHTSPEPRFAGASRPAVPHIYAAREPEWSARRANGAPTNGRYQPYRRRRSRGQLIRRLVTTNCELRRLRTPPRTLTRRTQERGAAVTPTAPAAAGAHTNPLMYPRRMLSIHTFLSL